MKVITKTRSASEAFGVINKLSEAGIYSALSGCAARGYEVLVRDGQAALAVDVLGTANGVQAAQELSPEVTK